MTTPKRTTRASYWAWHASPDWAASFPARLAHLHVSRHGELVVSVEMTGAPPPGSPLPMTADGVQLAGAQMTVRLSPDDTARVVDLLCPLCGKASGKPEL